LQEIFRKTRVEDTKSKKEKAIYRVRHTAFSFVREMPLSSVTFNAKIGIIYEIKKPIENIYLKSTV